MVNLISSEAVLAKFFSGLGDPSRMAILEALRDGPRSVGDIVQTTGRSQPNVSNHLACLFDCGLVAREQRGRNVYYRLSDDRIATMLGLAEQVLSEVARGVYECIGFDRQAQLINPR